MSDDTQRPTTNTEPHLHSDMRLDETVTTERDVPMQPERGSPLAIFAHLLRWWTWVFIVLALLAPLAAWSWPGELAANCAKLIIPALLPGLLVFRRERLAGLLICLALLAVSFPWIDQAWEDRAPAIDPAGPPPIRVLVANTAWWNPLPPEPVATAILDAQADILVLVEAREDILELLRREGPWNRWHVKAARDEFGPYSIAMGTVLNRVEGDRMLRIQGPAREDPELEERGLTDIDTVPVPIMRLEQDTRPFLLVGLHPPPPMRPSLWRQQIDTEQAILDHLAGDPRPAIVAGDWNLTPASALWRAAHAAGLRRSAGREPATWIFSSFGWLRPIMGLPLDRVVVRGMAAGPVETITIPGSDHLGVVVSVQLPPLEGDA